MVFFTVDPRNSSPASQGTYAPVVATLRYSPKTFVGTQRNKLLATYGKQCPDGPSDSPPPTEDEIFQRGEGCNPARQSYDVPSKTDDLPVPLRRTDTSTEAVPKGTKTYRSAGTHTGTTPRYTRRHRPVQTRTDAVPRRTRTRRSVQMRTGAVPRRTKLYLRIQRRTGAILRHIEEYRSAQGRTGTTPQHRRPEAHYIPASIPPFPRTARRGLMCPFSRHAIRGRLRTSLYHHASLGTNPISTPILVPH